MKLLRCCTALVLSQLLAIGASFASIEISTLTEPVTIAGLWKFQPGDNPTWSAPDLDDSAWAEVRVPAQAPDGYPGFRGMAWYRLTLDLGPLLSESGNPPGNLAIMLGAVESAYEIFAGGQRLGGVGQLPPEPSPLYNQYAVYQIPVSAVDPQGRLVLAMRVWRYENAAFNVPSGPYEGPFLLGSSLDLGSSLAELSLAPDMLMATLYLAIGLYHLFIARRNPTMREFFWFGWFAVGLALYSMETSQWRYNIDIPFLWHLKLEYTVLYLLPVLAAEVMCRIARIGKSPAMRIFQLVFLLFAITVAVIPTIDINYLTLPYFQYLAALWALYTAVSMGRHAYRGNREATALSVLLLILVVSVVNDLFLGGVILGTANTIYIVFAMTILLMAVLMANHYTATLATLEKSVEERTIDLLKANRELKEASAIKEQFLANMSHELRTPMNAIIGLTRLSLQTDLDAQQRDYLSKVDASASNLQNIIDSVLDFSKLHAGELELVNAPFDLKRLIKDLAIATEEQLADREELSIRFDCDAALPDSLLGDATKLSTILRNLIGNAIKFTPQGNISVSITASEIDSGRARVNFSVTDTGIGIAAAHLEKLFDGFNQADNSFSRAYGGAGLGLATAQELARLMGGEITVRSREGEGSTFSFSLEFPLEVKETAEGSQLPAAGESGTEQLAAIRGASILVVDDSEINLQIAREILQQAGFQVDMASDGKQAVTMVSAKAYDCVLMDLQMPVMDGFSATGQIRNDKRFEKLPILAMTANFSDEDRARASEAGMNAHIPKPIDTELLFEELCRWITPGNRDAVVPDRPAAVSDLPTLPEVLPGLQIADGLRRVGGNQRLYLKLLKDLEQDYLGSAERIRGLMAENKVDEASSLAHKLRGIANNLGASDVGEIAGDIEQNLTNDANAASQLILALGESLEELGQSIRLALNTGKADVETGELDEAQIARLLDQLAQEISDCNPAAADTGETLLSGLNKDSRGADELRAVVQALDVFDFTDAENHLLAVRAALN